jgi:methylenetetrahydrofolate reductase (NADPH)
MCGARLPELLAKKLEAAGEDKEKIEQIGIEHATSQCEDLIRRGAPGLHFYTLNKSRATREIFLQLKNKKVVP